MSQPVLSFLMLYGTDSWRIDIHSLPSSALYKGSCNHNELQSGLFGTILIFDANIWDEQAFWRTQRYDNPNFSHSLCDLSSWWITTITPMSVKLLNVILTSVHLCLPWPLSSHFLSLLLPSTSTSPFFLCLSFHLSAAQSPTVTDPLQQAYAGVQHYAGDLSLPPPLLSLTSSICPFASSISLFWFVTSVGIMTGRDGQMTNQFPPWLVCFTLELQKGGFGGLEFAVTQTHTCTHIKKNKKTLILKVH